MRKKAVLLITSVFLMLMLSSCWNYREVNEMAIVIGAAIDKGVKESYMLTVELLDVSGGPQTQISTKFLSVEGETVFDAVRRLISFEGKRGYWGHIRILIISEELARQDIAEVIKYFRQDAETRGDLYVTVSKGYSARDILSAEVTLGDVMSESLAKSIENSKFMSEIPETRLYTLSQDLKSGKIAAVLPAITLETQENKRMTVFSGAAVFQQDRLTDYLTEEETRAMLFLKNEVRGGVFVTKMDNGRISFEILGNNTKIKTMTEKDPITIDITVETQAAIDEVIGDIDFNDLAVLEEIKRTSEMQLKKSLEKVINRAKNMKADIFGFGQKIYENDPKKWNEISDDYVTEFTNIEVNITVKVDILNTAIIYKQVNGG